MPGVAHEMSTKSQREEDSVDLLKGDEPAKSINNSKFNRRVFSGVVSFVCIGACLCAAYSSQSQSESHQEQVHLNMRQLLESSDMVDTATDSIRLAGERFQTDKTGVHTYPSYLHKGVRAGFRGITSKMEAADMAKCHELDLIGLNEEQSRGILKLVESVSDDRVQKIGRAAANVVAKTQAQGHRSVKRALIDTFKKQLPELRKLRDEIMPIDQLEAIKATSHSLDDMRILRELAKKDIATTIQESVKSRRMESVAIDEERKEQGEIAAHVLAVVSELAGLVLEQVEYAAKKIGFEDKINIPFWSELLTTGTDYVAEVVDCVLEELPDVKQVMTCPVKYADLFFELMRELEEVEEKEDEPLEEGSETPTE